MPVTVGKYALKLADNAADWIQDIKFARNADLATDQDDVLIVNMDDIERQLSYSRTGRDQLKLRPPGGVTLRPSKEKYANFVEFVENTNDPVHMPVLKVDDEGMISFADGSTTYRALKDAGLKEIPILINRNDAAEIPGHMLSLEGTRTLKQADVPITKPSSYEPKKLTEAQQKVFDYEVGQLGRPAHTAKSIALGELDMSPAAKAARRFDQGYTETVYHGGSPAIKNVNELQDGFWTSRNPIVANTYTKSDTDFTPAMYELTYNPANVPTIDAGGREWRKLADLDVDIQLPDGTKPNLYSDLDMGESIIGMPVEDTNHLARLSRGLGLGGMRIDNLNDAGYNFGAAKRSLRDSYAKINPDATATDLDKAWQQFLKDYESMGDTNVVFSDPSGIRSATGAAFDPRNKALPNIMGGSAAVAVGLGANDSEAAVKQLDTIMAGGMKTPAEQAQAVISGQSLTPQGPTFSGPANKTIADNLVASPDVGTIQATQPGILKQLAGDVGFALQDFGKSAQDAGPLGFLAGSAIESTGDIAQRYAYGESEVYDPALLGLNALGLTPAAFMSSGMRGAMRNPDAKYSIFKELFGN